MKTRVFIRRCASYRDALVYDAVKGSVDGLGGMGMFVKKGERILIKPNLLAARPPEAAVTTHPSVVKAVIRLVKECGALPVVGDSPGIGSSIKIAEKSGVLNECLASGAPYTELKGAVEVQNPSGHTFKRLQIASDALKCDGIINLPKLKTHAQMLLTLGVKNMFGCVPGKRKPQWHLAAGTDESAFAGMLLDLYLYLRPRLTIMDGITAMQGNGPANGEPRHLGLVLASKDAVALDAVIAEVLSIAPDRAPIQRVAIKRGIREAVISNIDIEGEDIKGLRLRDFRLPPEMHTNFAAYLPYFLDKRLRKAITARPHIKRNVCTMCNVCVTVCPPEVMEKTDRIHIDYDRCIRCYCCQESCPHGAIEPREGWLKRIIPGL
jgi:uncharacterized protein (DUF362 family)/ferredoxin